VPFNPEKVIVISSRGEISEGIISALDERSRSIVLAGHNFSISDLFKSIVKVNPNF